MCTTCGCSDANGGITIQKIGRENQDQVSVHEHKHSHTDHAHHHHHHHHGHDHHADSHHHSTKTLVQLEEDILSKNNQMAARNRGYLEAKEILALNLVSSPGSGKTTLLEKTITDLSSEIDFAIIEGDQQTSNDAQRIDATGAPVVQINTGKGCHLDADMVHKAIKILQPSSRCVLMIENVGNLVCPALFDLGENARVVIMSVTEGADKPIKYPDMFHSAQLCIINKIDLLPYVEFDVEQAKQYAKQVNHHLEFVEISATTGQGMDNWYDWLKNQVVHTKEVATTT